MIKKALETFIAEGAVAELRVLNVQAGNGYTANYTGFFNDMDKMEKAAKKYSGKAPAVYFTLQQCKPDIIARANNQMKKAAKTSISTKDSEIEKYNWLPIDLDAKRMAGISATDKEHDAAIERARAIFQMLTSKGWPMPVVGDSGNGAHICFKVDLENTEENKNLVQKCLLALSQKFSDDAVEVDKTVFNPARIWKLYGTMTMKGDATEDRPHRMAKIMHIPDSIGTVTIEQLKELASMAAEEKKDKPVAKASSNNCNQDGIDVVEWCNKHYLEIGKISDWKDAVKYQLLPCPFNSDHSEALIIKQPSGAVAFKCSHNGCVGKDWQALREMFEPQAQRTRLEPASRVEKKSKHNRVDPRIDVVGDMAEMREEISKQIRGESVTIPMPWPRVSTSAKAFRPGSLTILAGPLKTGKSFFAQNIVRHVNDLGFTWAYLPLEDSRTQWAWRQLAILAEDYKMIDVDQEGAEYRMAVYEENIVELQKYLSCVSQNPRIGMKDNFGNTIVPQVPHKVIVDWVREMAKNHRFIVVDPVSQIDSEGNRTWEEESWFMRQILGILADTGATLLLLTHTIKRGGAAGKIAITAEDVQGSSMFVKLAHTTLLIDACEMKTSQVYRTGGKMELVEHDREVMIAAARNGGGSRTRIAFLQNKNKPVFEELGIIAPKGSK